MQASAFKLEPRVLRENDVMNVSVQTNCEQLYACKHGERCICAHIPVGDRERLWKNLPIWPELRKTRIVRPTWGLPVPGNWKKLHVVQLLSCRPIFFFFSFFCTIGCHLVTCKSNAPQRSQPASERDTHMLEVPLHVVCEWRVPTGTGCTGKFQPWLCDSTCHWASTEWRPPPTTAPPGAPSPSQTGPRTVSPLLTNDQHPQSQEQPVALGLAAPSTAATSLIAVPSPWRVLTMVASTANCVPPCSGKPSTATSNRRASGPIWDLQIQISDQNVRGDASPSLVAHAGSNTFQGETSFAQLVRKLRGDGQRHQGSGHTGSYAPLEEEATGGDATRTAW